MHDRDHKRIRRPHAEPLTLAAPQAPASTAYMDAASVADPGHNFGLLAVTAPRLIRQADGGRDGEETDTEERTPPTLLPTDGLDVEIAGSGVSGDETDAIPMDNGSGRSAGPVRIRAKLDLTTNLKDEATDPEKKSDFGITHFNRPTYTTRSVSRERGAFVVKAALASDITVKVRPTLGPNGQVNIEGEDDSDITNANYPAIVQDLTPFPGKPEAGSPCAHFWARDLTLEHEHFHAGEDEHYGKQGAETAQGQLNGLRAKDTAAVDALLDRVPDFILGNVGANMGPAGERRAYSHVSPDYQARADAIKKKGDRGKYPPPP